MNTEYRTPSKDDETACLDVLNYDLNSLRLNLGSFAIAEFEIRCSSFIIQCSCLVSSPEIVDRFNIKFAVYCQENSKNQIRYE
jgi:hypothetical protein